MTPAQLCCTNRDQDPVFQTGAFSRLLLQLDRCHPTTCASFDTSTGTVNDVRLG